MNEIKLLEDNSEIVSYNFPSFPVYARKCRLSNYPNMTVISHWHADLEFIVILQGRMLYSINGKNYLLEEGQSLFVNSNRLHFGHSIEGQDCYYLCVLFHPSLLYITEDIKESYVEAICQGTSLPYLIFSSSNKLQNENINKLIQIYEISQEKALGFELAVLSHIYSLWLSIFENIKKIKSKEEPMSEKRRETLYSMIGYIQKHYSEKIILKDIAAAGSVCRSSCCDIFSSLLQMTPMEYLTNYRLEKSIGYLSNSKLSITEIALLCGFNSSSYFTEIFHREMGCTPTEYKIKFNNSALLS